MIYGYLRVSTDGQDENNQRTGIVRYADYMQYTIDEWVIEHGISGAKDYKKRLLGRLIDKLIQGDILLVSEFTRLSRDTFQMYEICKILVDRGVKVFSVKDNSVLDLSADGKFKLAMFCYFAEKERERTSERTKEALKAKKAAGQKLGRPQGPGKFKLDVYKDYILELIKNGETMKTIAFRTGVDYSTVCNYIHKKLKIKTWDKRKPKTYKSSIKLLYPQILALREAGLSYAEIAKKLNITRSSAYTMIKNHGEFKLKKQKNTYQHKAEKGVLLLTSQGAEQ